MGIIIPSIICAPFSAHRGRFEVIVISGESYQPAVLVCLMASPNLNLQKKKKKKKSSHTDNLVVTLGYDMIWCCCSQFNLDQIGSVIFF